MLVYNGLRLKKLIQLTSCIWCRKDRLPLGVVATLLIEEAGLAPVSVTFLGVRLGVDIGVLSY